MAPSPDRRLTPATDRVALRGAGVARDVITEGERRRIAMPLSDLCRAPEGARDRQLLFGADVLLIEARGGWGFVQALADGYCGWVRLSALGDSANVITHRVSAPATHVYPCPDFKRRETMSLSLGSRLSVTGVEGRFARLAEGGFVPLQHLSDQPGDAAEIALSLLGTPYLWGGNSRWGIDCSGLAQAALHGAGIACPGDSNLQRAAFPEVSQIARGDLLFWPGHVALALDAHRMVHATAFAMAVITEPIAAAIARIDAAGEGPFLGARRPWLDGRIGFP